MERISEILSRVLKEGACAGPRAGTVVDWEREWVRAAGAAGEQSFPLGMEKGVLRVRVVNSSWLMELRRREPGIRKELETNTGVSVTRIVFTR